MTSSSIVAPVQFAAIDASVWISNLLSYDSNHVVAHNWVNQHINNGGYLVSPLILVLETGATIARVTQNSNVARDAVTQLYTFSYFSLVPMYQALIDEANEIAITFKLRGADSLYVTVAKQLSIPLVTFDNEQLTRPTSVITTIRP